MRVAVIGAGGVGGFLGGLLARAGHDVRFLARGQHLEAIRQRGLEVRSAQAGTFTVNTPASDRPEDLGQNDLVLVATKMYDFQAAAQAAKVALAPHGAALPIQNGLDAPYQLAEAVGRDRALIGTASIEAAILEPGVVGHMIQVHQVTVSELEGPPSNRMEDLVGELQKAGITATLAPDGRRALWAKAAPLIPFATITATADCGLGEMLGSPEMRALAKMLMDEADAVAIADGYDVRESTARFMGLLEKMAPSAPGFTSSMNRDFRNHKPVELEWLTGRIVGLGDEKGVPVPGHRALYAILKLKAERQATERENRHAAG